VFSNKLKEIGALLGASWTSPNPSGLQSLAWRYKWEENAGNTYKENLLVYNSEDCDALRLLVNKIFEISIHSGSSSDITFADQTQKLSTEIGKEIHGDLELILASSHATYDQKKIAFREEKNNGGHQGKNQKGRGGVVKMPPSKINKIIEVPVVKTCRECNQALSQNSKYSINIIIVDLKFTKSGPRKTIHLHKSFKSYCKTCKKYFKPNEFNRGSGNYIFGHRFMSWIVYQRIALRLPYRLIAQNSVEIFDEPIALQSINNILNYFADNYNDSESLLLEKILMNSFVHVDETPISIRGIDQYIWTFTDGKHVIFKLTETREANIVHKILCEYKGVLVSDFYSGYDSVACKQQKCWVHLIRDINDDLWANPFDTEYEAFVLEVKELILPIFEAVDKYGLKQRNLRKFKKKVDQFYRDNILGKSYHSELSIKYKKRFERYQDSLFTFLEYDSMPWHNNTAERSLRHIAVQRKISGSFFKSGATSYVALLGIMQTCRFQEKSFLKFLVSGEKDVDAFKSPKIRKRTQTAKKHT
jgi:hypothetical protein